MYTRCTHCDTLHEITPEVLAQGRGLWHCPACGREFDTLQNLAREPALASSSAVSAAVQVQGQLDFETLPDDGIEADSAIETVIEATVPDEPECRPSEAAEETATDEADSCVEVETGVDAEVAADAVRTSAHVEPDAPETTLETETDADAKVTASDTPAPHVMVLPSFIPTPKPPRRPGTRAPAWPRWLAVFLLALLLGSQCVVAELDGLAADARWRPALERGCAVLGCTLPAWHDPAALHLLTRDVRPHPSVPDALLISASFRNDARWSQRWPRLQLTLSDLDGQAIARREFAPAEYLGLGNVEATISAGQSASITLEVRDPGKQAVAFEFDFR